MKNIRFYAGICLALFAFMIAYTAALRPIATSVQFVFSADAFHQIIHAWREQDLLNVFINHFYVDYVFLLMYAVIGYQVTRTYAKWLLPAAALFDALENSMQLYLINDNTQAISLLYALSGCFSAAKWLLIVLFVVIFVRQRSRLLI